MSKKCVLIILDSLGVGEMPDAACFGDEGSHTLQNTYEACGGLKLPHLLSLGLGHLPGLAIGRADQPMGAYGRAAEAFMGKDTTGGHWEIAGLTLDKPFVTFTEGFPPEVIAPFEAAIGKKILGNVAASGTEILKSLGDEHMRTGCPIIYTSADSVFQIAAHEDVIPLQELYGICDIARAQLMGDYMVGRVIARPFEGKSGAYTRTPGRRDFSVEPPRDTMLDILKANGFAVKGVGKIEDIFAHRGLTGSNHTTDNAAGIEATLAYMAKEFTGLVMTNLVDFDSLYGHRNAPLGYGRALETFDEALPRIMAALGPEDLLLITADHGCDPTTPSTDHSREYIPILAYAKWGRAVNLGNRDTFTDIGATIMGFFGLTPAEGISFLPEIMDVEAAR